MGCLPAENRIVSAAAHCDKRYLAALEWRMAQFQILLITIVRTLVEVAGWALIGQGILALLAGKARHGNPIYRAFQIVTGPVVRAVRAITPRFILDAHVPLIAFFLLFWLWIALAVLKRYVCALHHLAC
jgi:hypothetical protein